MKPERLRWGHVARWIVVTLLLIPAVVWGQQPLVLDKVDGAYSLNSHISVFKDTQGSLRIEQIASPDGNRLFERSSIQVSDADIYSSVHWIKAELLNPSRESKQLVLEIGYPFYDQVELFLVDSVGQLVTRKVSGNYPVYQRELSSRHFLFQLEIPANQALDVYLRLKTKAFMPMPIRLWEPDRLLSKLNLEQYIYGLFYGVMALLITYNFLVLMNSWDKLYLYYSASVGCLVAIMMSIDGFAFEFLWRHYPYFSYKSLPFFLFASVVFSSLMCRRFLGTKRNTPIIDYLLIAVIALAMAGASLALFLPYAVMVTLGIAMVFIGAMVSLLTGAVSLSREIGRASCRERVCMFV